MSFKNTFPDIIKKESSYILKNQHLNGSIVTPNPGGQKVIPYFANFAAMGLTVDSSYATALQKHLLWYLSHLECPDRWGIYGTVYDYIFDADGKDISTKDYDSADSYGATFLSLVRKYYHMTKDEEFLFTYRNELETIGKGIIFLQDKDGLTWAKPNYKVKFLMDNAEVCKGLYDLSCLEDEVYKDADKKYFFEKSSEAVKKGIRDKLWQGKLYAYGLSKWKKPYKSNPDKWYPDAIAQLYPIWTGVIAPDSPEANMVYGTFNKAQMTWPELKKTDDFPWCVTGYVSALLKDKERSVEYIRYIKERFLDRGHPWPWHPAESGFLILTLTLLA